MGRRQVKECMAPGTKRVVINWHVSMDEKRTLLNLSRDNETNLNEYVKRAVLGQKVVVRGSDYNRSRIISRIKELDDLMEKLAESKELSSDEVAELYVIKEIRRNWDVEKETA